LIQKEQDPPPCAGPQHDGLSSPQAGPFVSPAHLSGQKLVHSSRPPIRSDRMRDVFDTPKSVLRLVY